MFKTIKREDVKEVLITLLDTNGTTSALDVKRELRKRGFWATQSNVSQLLSDVYTEVQDVVRTNNGSYFEYSYEIEDEDSAVDEDCDDEDCDDEDVKPIGKSLSVSEPNQLSSDVYELIVNHNGEINYLVVSNDKNLLNVGTLVYEVRSKNDTWYLYSDDPTIITRHKAIYYVWKVVSNEYDGFLAYADLRSRKCK